jgi:hypothetical protein
MWEIEVGGLRPKLGLEQKLRSYQKMKVKSIKVWGRI